MEKFDEILGKLDRVKSIGENQWTACCPAHEDSRNSLGISVGYTGKILFCCWAGCSFGAIISELGIDARDLSTIRFLERTTPPKDKRPIFLASYLAAMSLPWPVVSGWSYYHADGSDAFAVYRLERPDGTKEIRPVRPVAGGYSFGLPPPLRPIYRLPRVLKSNGLVVIAEGEKAADAIAAAGWCATTSVGGASAAGKSDWSPLVRRRVVVWPDNDDVGVGYADQVGSVLKSMGADVTVMDPIGGPGDDAADCLDVCGVLAKQGMTG